MRSEQNGKKNKLVGQQKSEQVGVIQQLSTNVCTKTCCDEARVSIFNKTHEHTKWPSPSHSGRNDDYRRVDYLAHC